MRKRAKCAKGEKGKTSEMACDMITFSAVRNTVFPFAREAEVICAFSAYVVNAQVIVKGLWIREGLYAVSPLTLVRRGGVWGERIAKGTRVG
jgi:hypothetical protein